MQPDNIKSVSIIGAGNVATHLATALFSKGIQISEIWSWHLTNAEELAKKTNATVCVTLPELKTNVDLIILAIKDDSVSTMINQLPKGIQAIVHTSGGLNMNVLSAASENIGVFYPLQSFKKEDSVDWLTIPICVEGNNEKIAKQLFSLGSKLSETVQQVNSTQRKKLHIAAVIANNFTNYLYSVSYDIIKDAGLSFSLLLPLIQLSVKKLNTDDPFLHQTGPAKRNDLKLINDHLDALKDDQDVAQLYQYLSDMVIKKTGN